MRLFSLQGRLAATLALCVIAGVIAGAGFSRLFDDARFAALAALLILLPLTLWLARSLSAPVLRLMRALEGAVASYRDGDFSFSLAIDRSDELGDLVRGHNLLGATLREQRQHLAQRELLLDTVVQNTPVALVLVDGRERVSYANLAARHLLNEGRSLAGLDFAAVLAPSPAPLREALHTGEDSLFSVEIDEVEETFHVSQRGFRLQGRPHRLYLLRRMTRELSRQEVASWKKLIRVISHELNNSLAPISSMAHSGAELARRGELTRLPAVFATIGERARHLHGFIDGYARFAKLPAPVPQRVEWPAFVESLASHAVFRVRALPDAADAWFDRAQIEQALINLLQNAAEAGGPPDAIELSIRQLRLDGRSELRIEVCDRGSGMSEQVLANALLPFYSTKRSGTGLGLALTREIAEAHGGHISLANREGGGLQVSLSLPLRSHSNWAAPKNDSINDSMSPSA